MRFSRILAPAFLATATAFAGVDVKQLDDRVRVEIDGQLFTEYRFSGAPHVYFYPVIGPGGARMTRDYPMVAETPDEEQDHYHHRSLWFSHGAVNGLDFWHEDDPGKTKVPKEKTGRIVHEKFLQVKGGDDAGVIQSQNKWIANGTDEQVLTSVQTMRVHDRPAEERMFDFEVTLTAGEKDVLFGDSKEGTFAFRIAESMRLKRHKKELPATGRMVTSEGHKDGDAWGKRAKWVDYSGKVGDALLGIAIFQHPSNPRFPSRWHARDYGLFAANPFCEVPMDKTMPKGSGDFTLKAGQTIAFRYRVLIHKGDAEAAGVAKRYDEYAK